MMTHTQIKPLSAEDELKKTFDIFDIDGNGFISADEIKKTMENIGEPLTDDEVQDMIKAADRNGTLVVLLHLNSIITSVLILRHFYFKGDGKIDINGK